MNPYEAYVQKLADAVMEARTAPLGGFPDFPRPAPAANAPVALIFSPHPDDEVIIGGWALRLLRQSRWRVINIAVTQGSNAARQQPRWEELLRCCQCIGFDLQATKPGGLSAVNPTTRSERQDSWREMVQVISGILEEHQPRAIFFPHETDWNSTHIGTHHLVADALAALPSGFTCATVETEFWGQMPTPNILVESAPADVAAMITALTWHVGEVQRNPYHVTVPAWMMDNVRRGGEWIGGQGKAAPEFLFGTMYRLRKWIHGRFEPCPVAEGFLDANLDPAAPFAM
jgi:LmbE family N-acetylglucosaminyl deacetylase